MEYKSENRHKCLECGEQIYDGRIDKRFCSKSCKNSYNNHKRQKVRAVHSIVRGRIEKNYEVLDKLYRMNVLSVNMGDLVLMGFNPDFFTGCRKNKRHNEFHCYEYKYCISETRLFNLQKSEL